MPTLQPGYGGWKQKFDKHYSTKKDWFHVLREESLLRTVLECRMERSRGCGRQRDTMQDWMQCNDMYIWKKHSERRKHCTLAVVRQSPKNFTLSQTPFPRARDGQNLVSWRWSLFTTFTYKPSLMRMHAILSYHGNRVTDPQTHTHTPTNTQTHRQDRLQYTVPRLANVQCNKEPSLEKTGVMEGRVPKKNRINLVNFAFVNYQ